MENKEHLTKAGLEKIVALKANQNLGLPEKLKKAFPSVVAVARPLVKSQTIQDPQWIAGFTSAEGCFYILLTKSKTKIGFQVKLVFSIGQDQKDLNLLNSLIKFFDCGLVFKNKTWAEFIVTKFADIMDKIIPFFKKYPIQGIKSKDFNDWCRVAELIKEKKHLTIYGLDKIKKIKAGMNKKRK